MPKKSLVTSSLIFEMVSTVNLSFGGGKYAHADTVNVPDVLTLFCSRCSQNERRSVQSRTTVYGPVTVSDVDGRGSNVETRSSCPRNGWNHTPHGESRVSLPSGHRSFPWSSALYDSAPCSADERYNINLSEPVLCVR